MLSLRTRVIACCGVLLPCVMACGSVIEEDIAKAELPSQCGSTWDLEQVGSYNGADPVYSEAFVDKRQKAVGLHCSGTLISPNLFLTVSHGGCEAATGETVYFNCQEGLSDPNCDGYEATLIAAYPDSIDVAVSRLSGSPGNIYGWTFPSARVPQVGEHLAIIGHPVADDRKKMVGFGDVLDVNTTDGKLNLEYVIDTSGGVSGAGVLDKSGLLVGLHRSAGCNSSSSQGNNGTAMKFVFDNVPEVRDVVVAGWMTAM